VDLPTLFSKVYNSKSPSVQKIGKNYIFPEIMYWQWQIGGREVAVKGSKRL
jgi:hypothetical protein